MKVQYLWDTGFISFRYKHKSGVAGSDSGSVFSCCSRIFTQKSFPLDSTAAAAKSLQLCPTLCDRIDGSPVPGILQARNLEWVAISFSNAWKWTGKVKLLSRVRLFATPWTAAHQAPPSMGFSRQEYWSGCHCLLQIPLLLTFYNVPSIFLNILITGILKSMLINSVLVR